MAHIDAITLTHGDNNKSYLILNNTEKSHIDSIIQLLKPFKECGEKLSSEANVTISLIVPLFQKLKSHLSPSQTDTTIIKDMKTKMLAKLNNRYTTDQMKSLKTCTLLDVRYKNCDYVKDDFDQLENEIRDVR